MVKKWAFEILQSKDTVKFYEIILLLKCGILCSCHPNLNADPRKSRTSYILYFVTNAPVLTQVYV